VFTHVFRKNGHPILVALAGTHHDHLVIEIDILQPQAKHFHGAQAAAIEQPGHQ